MFYLLTHLLTYWLKITLLLEYGELSGREVTYYFLVGFAQINEWMQMKIGPNPFNHRFITTD